MESTPYEFEKVSHLAGLLQANGDYGAAEPLLRQALDAQENILGPDDPITLLGVNKLAYLLRTKGDFNAAESLYRRALGACERRLGPEHPDTIQSVVRLAGLLQSRGDLRSAEPLLRRALGVRERNLGAEDSDTLASVASLANVLEKIGEPGESAALRTRVVVSLPERGPTNPNPYGDRGAALELYRLGNYAAAEGLLTGLLACGFELASTHCHVARICLLTGRDDDARDHISRAWEARDDASPYVVARILWLQLAMVLADSSRVPTSDDGLPSDVASLLGKLKTLLQSNDAVHEWAMRPVLDHLESHLSGEQNALLAALVAALSDHGAEALEALECWNNQPPIAVAD